MLVFASPPQDCPHGDVQTLPGELVIPTPIVCDAGRRNDCSCVRTWAGVSSRKSTEVAEVIERDDLTFLDYADLLIRFLIERDAGTWDSDYAREQVMALCDLAEDYRPGTFVRIGLSDDYSHHVFSALEPS